MFYARIENNAIAEYPLYEGDIKLRFPNTSFASPFSPPENYVAVEASAPPEYDYKKNITEGTPQFINGKLTQVWLVNDASQEEISERTAYCAKSAREDRNQRLAQSDWTQLPDSPVNKSAWAAYRQQLRDISSQEGFPWAIIWPDEP